MLNWLEKVGDGLLPLHIEVLAHLGHAGRGIQRPQDCHPLLGSKGVDSLGLVILDSSVVSLVLALISC